MLASETLIVFTSDHGATFESGNRGASVALDSNRPFRGQKRTLWEGGIRVPAVVVWPGHVSAGAVSSEVTHMTDLLPTFLAIAGGSPDPAWRVDGRDQSPTWTGSAASRPPPRTLFWEWRAEGTNQVAAMRGDLKLVVSPGARPELFDVAADPAERREPGRDPAEGMPTASRKSSTPGWPPRPRLESKIDGDPLITP